MISPYGVIYAENHIIQEFREKPKLDVFIHGKIDIFEAEVLRRFPDKGQMEDTICPTLAKENQFAFF